MDNHLKQPIIFLGFGRCGSTIVSEVIFQHHKLAWVSNYQQKFPSSSKINLLRNLFDNQFWRYNGQKDQLNEVPLFNKYIFKPAESYRFWNSITEREFARGFLYRKEEENQKREQIRSFFSDMVKYQNRERLGFKITGPARLGYLHSIFPNAAFIFIKRKPLPNIRSMLKVGFYQDRKDKLWWYGDGIYSQYEKEKVKHWAKDDQPAFIAALQYHKVHALFEKEAHEQTLHQQILEVWYEDFIQQPQEIIARILQDVHLKRDANIDAYFANNAIYNRNKKETYYISPDLDDKILDIAVNGIE